MPIIQIQILVFIRTHKEVSKKYAKKEKDEQCYMHLIGCTNVNFFPYLTL